MFAEFGVLNYLTYLVRGGVYHPSFLALIRFRVENGYCPRGEERLSGGGGRLYWRRSADVSGLRRGGDADLNHAGVV